LGNSAMATLPPPDAEGPIAPFARKEMRTLELLFDDPSLSKLRKRFPEHPAVSRYDLLARFVEGQVTLNYPNETDLVLGMGSSMLDVLSLPETPDEVIARLAPEVLEQVRKRVNDPAQFWDQMVGLQCWSLLRSRGLSVDVVEREGLPDLRASVGEPSGSQWIEAKRIRLGTNPERVRSVISTANKQIKRADEGVGSVYLQIERPEQRVVFGDEIPPRIQPYINEVYRELGSSFSRSVADVIVAWDDYMVLDSPPDSSLYALRRRSLVIGHTAPRAPSALPGRALDLGQTVTLPIEWLGAEHQPVATPSIRIGEVTVTELFRRECELPRYVRSVHAVEALTNADTLERHRFDDVTILLATRWADIPSKPYTLLVLAAERQPEAVTEIYLAFRLCDEGDFRGGKGLSPLKAFEELLGRYGAPIKVGNEIGTFIPRTRIERQPEEGQRLVQGQVPSGQPICVNAFITKTAAGPIDITWAFAILTAPYQADVLRHRR
jgi:hypothetical protein